MEQPTGLTSQYFMVLDTANGFGYVGENNNPGKIVRVKLGPVPSEPTALTLTGHDRAYPVCIVGGQLYLSMDITTSNSRLGVVDLRNFSLVGVRSPKLTVAFSQSSYILMTYRVVGLHRWATRTSSSC